MTSTADKDEKTLYTEEEGYPILPSTKPIPTTPTTTTTTVKATTPRLVFFTNSPTTRISTGLTTRARRTPAPRSSAEVTTTTRTTQTSTTVTTTASTTTAPTTTTETSTTRNVVLEVVQKAIDKYEKKDKDLEKDSKEGVEKVEDEESKPMRDVPKKRDDELLVAQMEGILPRLLIYLAPGIGRCPLYCLNKIFRLSNWHSSLHVVCESAGSQSDYGHCSRGFWSAADCSTLCYSAW